MVKICKHLYKLVAQGPKMPKYSAKLAEAVIQMLDETPKTVWDKSDILLSLQASDKIQKKVNSMDRDVNVFMRIK